MGDERILELISKNLKRLMKEENINQPKLGLETGLSQPTISKYLSGTMMPSVPALVRMSEALFCSLDDFLEEV